LSLLQDKPRSVCYGKLVASRIYL